MRQVDMLNTVAAMVVAFVNIKESGESTAAVYRFSYDSLRKDWQGRR